MGHTLNFYLGSNPEPCSTLIHEEFLYRKQCARKHVANGTDATCIFRGTHEEVLVSHGVRGLQAIERYWLCVELGGKDFS